MAIIDTAMTPSALARARLHVYNVCSTGSPIILIKPGTKDSFGTILTESTLTLKAFPIRYNPYDRDVTQKIAWAENTDVLCYTSKKELDLLNVTIEQARRYKFVRVGSKQYNLRYVELYSKFADDFLYVIIGGKV
jgi:hypothetical protein